MPNFGQRWSKERRARFEAKRRAEVTRGMAITALPLHKQRGDIPAPTMPTTLNELMDNVERTRLEFRLAVERLQDHLSR